ncbi:MAG: hypothetical protein R2873_13485 [Caldilineaceae bacterium]
MSRQNHSSDAGLADVSGKNDIAPTRRRQVTAALLVLSLVWLGPILACGSFQPLQRPRRLLHPRRRPQLIRSRPPRPSPPTRR